MAARKQFKTLTLADMANLNETARKEQSEKMKLLDEANNLEFDRGDPAKIAELRQKASQVEDVFSGFTIEKKAQGPPKKKNDAAENAANKSAPSTAAYCDLLFRGSPVEIGGIEKINLLSMTINDDSTTSKYTCKVGKNGSISKVNLSCPLGWTDEAIGMYCALGKKRDEITEVKCDSPAFATIIEFFTNIYRRFFEFRKESEKIKNRIKELEASKKTYEGFLNNPSKRDEAKKRLDEIQKELDIELRKPIIYSDGKLCTPLKIERLMEQDPQRIDLLTKVSMLGLSLQFNSFKPGGDPISQIYDAKKMNIKYKVGDEPPKTCPAEWIREEDGGLTTVGEQAINELRKKHNNKVQKIVSYDPLTYETAGDDEESKPVVKRLDPQGLFGKRLRIINIDKARIECSTSQFGLAFSFVPHKITAELVDSGYYGGLTEVGEFDIGVDMGNVLDD